MKNKAFQLGLIVGRFQTFHIGHLDKVRRMVEDGEDCADVLIQLSAVKSEINNTGKLILKQHMEHCIVEAVRENDQTSIDKMNEAIDRFMK